MKHSHQLKTKELDQLYQAILKIKNVKEARKFFRDLCTLEELKAMSDRWQAVRMIAKGVPYREIAKKLKMSSATVTRVAQWLNYGKGGYKSVLKKLKIK
ncbi:helix-turn-helix domain-containing protein [Patescibacteria group bacterium]|nr:helix-turn-helix domain-containing protein [Patescibacteria group bacterium]